MPPKYQEVFLFCMGRGGGNAILNWIAGEYDTPVKMVSKRGMQHYFNEKRDLEDANWVIRQNILHGHASLFQFNDLLKKHPEAEGYSKRVVLYSLRDHYNMLASWFKIWETEDREYHSKAKANAARDDYLFNRIIPAWKEIAKEACNQTNLLSHHSLFINYNLWVSDKDYRHCLATFLGLDFKDKNINYMPGKAGGSSFDGMTYQNNASALPVLDRWQRMVKNKSYRKIVNDPELVDYSKRLFDFAPKIGN